jgi:hypothetical protein
MVSRLGHFVNKAVLVSIPRIFADIRPRNCRLISLEASGLWLESEELLRIAFSDAERTPNVVFVPFTQVAYLVGVRPAPRTSTTRARTGPPKTRGPRPQAEVPPADNFDGATHNRPVRGKKTRGKKYSPESA